MSEPSFAWVPQAFAERLANVPEFAARIEEAERQLTDSMTVEELRTWVEKMRARLGRPKEQP